jgi:hypothetical protein
MRGLLPVWGPRPVRKLLRVREHHSERQRRELLPVRERHSERLPEPQERLRPPVRHSELRRREPLPELREPQLE